MTQREREREREREKRRPRDSDKTKKKEEREGLWILESRGTWLFFTWFVLDVYGRKVANTLEQGCTLTMLPVCLPDRQSTPE